MAAQTLTIGIPVTVLCLCIAGSFCTCPPGKYGWNCNVECKCKQGTSARCDEKTGTCDDGCDVDRYGPHCLFDRTCIYDSSGLRYTGTLNTTKNGHTCLRWNDSRVLPKIDPTTEFPEMDVPENYCRNPKQRGGSHTTWGPWCYIALVTGIGFEDCNLRRCPCPDYLYGDGCMNQCHCYNSSEICDRRSGVCRSGCAAGWVGKSCDKKCVEGKYGIGCANICSNCFNSSCHHETGKCLLGCKSGYKGEFCNQECTDYMYGKDCNFRCGKCAGGKPCDTKTGECPFGCAPGYSYDDRMCITECPTMLYGQDCRKRCGYCKDGPTCHHETGVCKTGCKLGYHGDMCLLQCNDHFYGEECSNRCGSCKNNGTCDKASGNCLYGCSDGFIGADCRTAIVRSPEKSVTAGIAAGVGAFTGVIIIVIIIILILRIRRRNKMSVSKSYMDEVKEDGFIQNERCELLADSRIETLQKEIEDNNKNEEMAEPIYANLNGRKQSSPVKLEDLHAYIVKNKENNCDGFRKEFEELPMGLLALCEVARRPENKAKNRYGNIVAYDHSRVVLEPLLNEPYSDYVNASFMDGYNKPKAFVASQGPNKMMIRDFWRMVWQQRVSKIVMLTNLVEACKKKCEQYWPDDGTMKYGDVTVRIVDTAKYTDFIIRTFEISKDDNSRIVKQFHFCTWSDHGAPTYPTTLLAFRRKVQSFNPESTAPILCHCSAGIGRTGTYIGLHYLLDQAMAEGQVDVLQAAHNMRSNRVNMIQTCEQYIFVYDALLEAIKAKDTTIPKSSFRAAFEEMSQNENGNETSLEKQYEIVQLLSPTIDRSECSAALMEENLGKNRFRNVLPVNRSRPFLYTPVDGCNDYINAVFLSSYTQKDRFIVTQMPLPNTVADFWRMIYDYNSDAIVMLNEFDRNDKSCALYWPEEYGYTEEHGPLSVELLSSSDVDPDVTLRIFKLSHMGKGEERAVKQFMFKSWPDYKMLPNSVTSLLRLHRQVTDWYKQNGKGPVTIHCMNGASKSGILVATSLILERLELDLEVDVYQAVKQIRINRPQFIESFEQYQFLYQMVLEYLDSQE
ncbi:receptor-type tyrosine-protein phosphatase kappa-like [Pomacea canaliculata]|uniref:receptor-type tyrosine-protein phosphatase kappa-like n=1 Tax=Pomacea canaliculata TaxID=400727 RepID=UPI000D73FACF|nr:receptor-type tyrosine-protein phosphatase kappa-like [Pomacea canaliculata]